MTHGRRRTRAAGLAGGTARWTTGRMEFLRRRGVLRCACGELYWKRLPQAREGELTRLRAAVVDDGARPPGHRPRHRETLRLGRGEARRR